MSVCTMLTRNFTEAKNKERTHGGTDPASQR